MSDLENVNVPEGTPEGEEGKESGEKNFVSKEEYDKILDKVDGLAKKNDELVKIFTSPAFLQRQQPPAPKEPERPKAREYTQEEIDNMTPSQLTAYTLSKVNDILVDHSRKQDEKYSRLENSIQSMAETDEDRETQREIAACKEEFGKEDFEKMVPDMLKISELYPNIRARDAYLIAVGKKNPPLRKPVPKPTSTEKPTHGFDIKDANLSPDDAAEKAYDMVVGGKDKIK